MGARGGGCGPQFGLRAGLGRRRAARVYLGQFIQFCIALSDPGEREFNGIVKHIIKKSLFTERQVEIILRQRRRQGPGLGISRGAYYRQAAQSREKVERLYYTVSLLYGLGVLESRDIGVMSDLAERIGEIKDGDISPDREAEITSVLDQIIAQACKK